MMLIVEHFKWKAVFMILAVHNDLMLIKYLIHDIKAAKNNLKQYEIQMQKASSDQNMYQ